MDKINAYSQVVNNYYQNNDRIKKTKDEKDKETQIKNSSNVEESTEVNEKKKVTGMRTYGDAKLSDTALDYYKNLTKKYSNLNFVLVASDKKQEAEMMKGSFASGNGLTVLIDTDKIERMATDEKYAKQIESILTNASSQLNTLKTSLESNPNVKSYGMSINKDNRASFFATVDKQMKEQREKIKERREEKRAEAKAKEKADAKKEAKDKIAEDRKVKLDEKYGVDKKQEDSYYDYDSEEDTVTIEASSVEELLRKIEAYEKYGTLDNKYSLNSLGKKIDYSI